MHSISCYNIAMSIEWKAFEHGVGDKNPEWYVATSIMVIAVVVTSIIFNNILLAVIVGLGFLALIVAHRRGPREVHAVVGDKGIRVDDYLYTYDNLEAYYLNEERGILMLLSKKLLASHIIIPLAEDTPAEEIDILLAEHLEEREMHETIFEHFMEYLGF